MSDDIELDVVTNQWRCAIDMPHPPHVLRGVLPETRCQGSGWPAEEPPTCQACRFVHLDDEADAMFCRRYPPTAIGTDLGDHVAIAVVFPQVDVDDWCGEYQTR